MTNIYTELGEGIFWDNLHNSLFWVDINQSLLFSCTGGKVYRHQLVKNVSTVLFVKEGQIYLTNRNGIIRYSLDSHNIHQVSRMPDEYKSKIYRANDGIRLDDNLYIYGVMRDDPIKNDGALILSRNGVSKVILTGITIPNTFIKIPNSNSLLIADSFKAIIYKITFNNSWESVQSQVKWFDLSHTNAAPDGGCISSDGRIFVAIWDGFKILELNLNGELVDEYRVPVPRPTNCTLNTEENQLFVTSAYEGLTECDRQKYPLSGSILTVDISI
jgi:sugar lactone lactonase YvrE